MRRLRVRRSGQRLHRPQANTNPVIQEMQVYPPDMHANDGARIDIHTVRWTVPAACDDAWRETPGTPGVYRWFLSGEVPRDFNWPQALTPIVTGDLIYVGKATSLRTRAKHHKLGTAKSTLRRALASLMGLLS
jgi:hypothetical protein